MDIGFIITASSLGVGLAGIGYGLWQARRARTATETAQSWSDRSQKSDADVVRADFARMKAEDRLCSAQADNDTLKATVRNLNGKFEQADAALVAERKAHSITKGLLTKARNANSAQATAAKPGG